MSINTIPYGIVGGPEPDNAKNGSMSPEIERCVNAFVAAYRKATMGGVSDDDGARTLAAKMAFEATWQVEAAMMSKLARPKGLVS